MDEHVEVGVGDAGATGNDFARPRDLRAPRVRQQNAISHEHPKRRCQPLSCPVIHRRVSLTSRVAFARVRGGRGGGESGSLLALATDARQVPNPLSSPPPTTSTRTTSLLLTLLALVHALYAGASSAAGKTDDTWELAHVGRLTPS